MSLDIQTTARLMVSSYGAAAELLAAAAKEMAEAAEAAEQEQINLAVGTALVAEQGVGKAKALIEAVKAIRSAT